MIIVKEKKSVPHAEDSEKENKIEILANIIFNAAKHGYMPYDTQDEYCAMEIAKKNIDKFIVSKKQEEPVSEDLEEASKNYALNNTPWDDCKDEIQEAFKDGAKWHKEQMMEKAIDGYVIEDIEEGNGDFLLSADYLPKSMGLKDRQKVKVIVIKED